jgi:hypothetical protein
VLCWACGSAFVMPRAAARSSGIISRLDPCLDYTLRAAMEFRFAAMRWVAS